MSEPHLILLPGNPQTFECSECSQLFLTEPGYTTVDLTDDFIEHLRVRHPSHYKFPMGIEIKLAKVSEGA
jgi:hypothetical protein